MFIPKHKVPLNTFSLTKPKTKRPGSEPGESGNPLVKIYVYLSIRNNLHDFVLFFNEEKFPAPQPLTASYSRTPLHPSADVYTLYANYC